MKALGEPFESADTVVTEWNLSAACDLQFGEYYQSAFLVGTVIQFIDAGLDYSCYYHTMDVDLHPEKWKSWYPEGLLNDLSTDTWGHHHRGLHMLKQDGTPSLSYTAFRLLNRMKGHRLSSPTQRRGIQHLITAEERCLRIIICNHGAEGCVRTEVDLAIKGLPDLPMLEERFSLSGIPAVNPAGAELRATRMGELPPSVVVGHASGKGLTTTIDCWPYCVHLLEFSW